MKFLEELESKVLHLIQRNKDLEKRVRDLEAEKTDLLAKNKELEMALTKKSSFAESLASEKNTIKNNIEELLSSIKELEKLEQKQR